MANFFFTLALGAILAFSVGMLLVAGVLFRDLMNGKPLIVPKDEDEQ